MSRDCDDYGASSAAKYEYFMFMERRSDEVFTVATAETWE